MFMAQGENGPSKHDLSSLKLLGSVGEPINPEAWMWYYKVIGKERCPIVDTWWQTETGGILISGAPGIWPVLMKPSSASLPLPSIDADVVDDDGKSVAPGTRGYLVIRKPWPGMLMTIYKDPDRFKQTYFSRFEGCYYAGDYAIMDKDGYFWLLGRADEVLKVAGHRLGTLELENVTVEHPAVAEAAAVGKPDAIKGEGIVIFAILREGFKKSPELEDQVRKHIRSTLGAVASPDAIYFVKALPKTRSGKIMRRVLKAIASEQTIGDVTTLEDGASVDEVKTAFEELRKAM
jgi:acetyl-CoA synthetase